MAKLLKDTARLDSLLGTGFDDDSEVQAQVRSVSRFTVVSTFSGCGGSSLGYKLAGGKVLLAVECDKNAVETYRKVFVMENVSGMVKGKMRLIFVEILRELKASGYRVSCRLMNTQWFGVPQARQRVIFIGVREDMRVEPSHPKAQREPITLREALRGVAFEEVPVLMPKYRAMAPHIRPGECAADHDSGKGFQNLTRPHWDRPCFTLTKMNNGYGRGTPLHPVENRSLSIPEAKRIGGFPDDFKLDGPFAERWARIGNSVPPMFMKAIADHIAKEILHRGRR